MKRRTLLAALGTISAGGAVVNGTGAFTSVEANRDLSVRVADDANAFLALEPNGPNAPYVETDGGTIGIDLTGDNDAVAGNGVNADAVTVFEDLFTVRNQGTQEVEVGITPLTFIDIDGFDTLLVLVVPESNFPTVTLGVGESEPYSLVVSELSPFDGSLEITDTITIHAEATQ